MSLCEVTLRRSYYHFVLIVLCHFAAFLALWLASIWIIIKVVFAAALIIYFCWYSLRYIIFQHASSINSIRLMTDQWRVKLGEQWVRAWPEGEVVVTSMLICFRLRVEGKHRPSYLILFPDSADPIELHAFRLRLILESSCLFGQKKGSSPEPE
ncbi:protein YgfX [Endozoicomonas sp.]|uniref:protein YgfX n=1 Tax=Endozoicomonas sp. TaxID=1892382 RepID=UPI00383BC314